MLRLAALALVFVGLAGFSRAAKPEPIFNGKNLDGWTIFADPKSKVSIKPLENWVVTDGIIVNKGTCSHRVSSSNEGKNALIKLKGPKKFICITFSAATLSN